MYNTLGERQKLLNKQKNVLTSVMENFEVGMQSRQGKEQYLQQMEQIVTGLQQSLSQKHEQEKTVNTMKDKANAGLNAVKAKASEAVDKAKSAAAGAVFALDRAEVLNVISDSAGSAMADEGACSATTNRSIHIVAGGGGFAWFQLLWPHNAVAAANNCGAAL